MTKNWVTKMTDKELIKAVQELHESIYTIDCFGTRDLLIYEMGAEELEKRGYQLLFRTKLEVSKND